MSRWRALVGVGAVLGIVACSRPPPRLAVELTARANAKAGVVPLVVSDAARAARLRALYQEVIRLARELDRARAAARAQCRSPSGEQKTAAAADPIGSGLLECLIAPPLSERDRALLDSYARLMIEARSLLNQREFDKLARVR